MKRILRFGALALLLVVAVVIAIWPRPQYIEDGSAETVVSNFYTALFNRDWARLGDFCNRPEDVKRLRQLRHYAFCRRVPSIRDTSYREMHVGDRFTLAGNEVVVPESAIGSGIRIVAADFGGDQELVPVRVLLESGRWLVDSQLLIAAAEAAKAAASK